MREPFAAANLGQNDVALGAKCRQLGFDRPHPLPEIVDPSLEVRV